MRLKRLTAPSDTSSTKSDDLTALTAFVPILRKHVSRLSLSERSLVQANSRRLRPYVKKQRARHHGLTDQAEPPTAVLEKRLSTDSEDGEVELHIALDKCLSDGGPTTPLLSPSLSDSSSSDEAISPRSSLHDISPPSSLRKRRAVIIPTRSSSIADPNVMPDWLTASNALLLRADSDAESLASWHTPFEEPSETPAKPLAVAQVVGVQSPSYRVPIPHVSKPSWRFDDLSSLSCTSTRERVRRYEERIGALALAEVDWWLDGPEEDEEVVIGRAAYGVRARAMRIPVPVRV